MLRKVLMGLSLPLLLVLALVLSACGGAAAVKPTWITPVVSGDSVLLPMATVQQDTIVHFWVTTPDGKESFMAYQYGGTTYVRADICVPCRSINFSLKGDILVCDSCGTTFSATSGKGVSGACKAYPKAEVKWQNAGGNLMVSAGDLATAYHNTVTRSGS